MALGRQVAAVVGRGSDDGRTGSDGGNSGMTVAVNCSVASRSNVASVLSMLMPVAFKEVTVTWHSAVRLLPSLVVALMMVVPEEKEGQAIGGDWAESIREWSLRYPTACFTTLTNSLKEIFGKL